MSQRKHDSSTQAIAHKFTHSPDLVWPEAGEGFVVTPQVEELIERGFAYLQAGYPIHLSGPAGTGKTTLALHMATKCGRPVMLIHGDDEFGSSDLVGNDVGFRKNRLVDQYVHSVRKEEEMIRTLWVDNRLTTACRYGHTLVYDEFTRSRPEANNVLLSVLGEEILNLPKLRYAGEGYLKVDPSFRAIFTSNPEEYAGIHKSQDALMDRLISIHVDYFDRETEVAITAARSGVSHVDAGRVVDLVRHYRERRVGRHRPSLRAAIMIARVVAQRGGTFDQSDVVYQHTYRDVLGLDRHGRHGGADLRPHDVISAELDDSRKLVEMAIQESS
jgi:nitric oxide reductase NorQ protein